MGWDGIPVWRRMPLDMIALYWLQGILSTFIYSGETLQDCGRLVKISKNCVVDKFGIIYSAESCAI